MGENQNKISFAENRLLRKHETLDNAALKQIVKSNADSIQAETGKQKEFQDAQAADKTKPEAEKTAENTGEDTHEKSLEAMKKLEIADVLKITQAQLSDLKAEVTRTKNFDKDEALETSEINVIAARIDKLKSNQVKDDEPEVKGEKKAEGKAESPTAEPSETLVALGYKPNAELPEDKKWMKSPEGGLQTNYLEGARKIWDSAPNKKKEFAEKLKGMETQLGFEVDKATFENKIVELIATYSQREYPDTKDFADIVECVEKLKDTEWKAMKAIFTGEWQDGWRADSIQDAMDDVQDTMDAKTKILQSQLGKLPENLIASRKAELPKLLAKINPEFVKDGKLQPAIMEYLLAGNDLMRDITLVGIAENWEKMKPKFAQLEGFLGKKIDEKASLKSLGEMAGDPAKLSDFEEKTKGLMSAFEVLGNVKTKGMDNAKILEMLEMKIGNGENINIVDFVNNGLPDKANELATKLGEVIKKVETITATANATLEKFGGKLPGLDSLAGLLSGNLDEATLKEMIANPESLEAKVLEILKKKFPNRKEIQEITTLDELNNKLAEYFATLETQLDNALTKLFTSGLKIKGVEINFDKDKLKEILPEIKAQLLPILSESLTKQTGAPLIGANGEIQLDNLDKIDGNETMKKVFEFFEAIEGKDKAEIEKYLKDNPETAKAVSEFCGNIFDTIMNSENPEIGKVRDRVAEIAPPELVEAMSKGMLESALNDILKAFEKGSIGEILGALLGVLKKLMGKFNMFMEWGKKQISPIANQAADAIEGFSPDTAAWLRQKTKPGSPEVATETPEQKLEKQFGFTAADRETLKTQKFTMEELMGENVDFAALKKKYRFTEGVNLKKLAEEIKTDNAYRVEADSKKTVNEFLFAVKYKTPAAKPAQPVTETPPVIEQPAATK
jgi:hypothetical protein